MFSIKNFEQRQPWKNWSGLYISTPSYYSMPKSIEEVCQVVREHKLLQKNIRVTGAAHSFSPVAMPEHTAMSLHHLRGLIRVDKEQNLATFYAGTYLYEIGPLLAQHGLALLNMGDIDSQTLAGVISTGTHGTGEALSSFSNMVHTWGFVNGHGEYIEHVRGEDDLSNALHVSLGLLGILVKVTIKVRPLYYLQYSSERQNLKDALANFQKEIKENRHLEWYYFPGSEMIQVKKMNEVAAINESKLKKRLVQLKTQAVENGLFYLLSEVCKYRPKTSKAVSQLSSKAISNEIKSGPCYEIYPTQRLVKFVETEYAIPLENFEACILEIHHIFKTGNLNVHFPIECRISKGEMGYLSPTQNQSVAYIAFHMYKGMDFSSYFMWIEQLMEKYGGRPHWGKLNYYGQQRAIEKYEHAPAFFAIRAQQDPHNIFVTSYYKRIFEKFLKKYY